MVREVDPAVPVYDVRTLAEHVDKNLFLRRIPARMFVVLGPLIWMGPLWSSRWLYSKASWSALATPSLPSYSPGLLALAAIEVPIQSHAEELFGNAEQMSVPGASRSTVELEFDPLTAPP